MNQRRIFIRDLACDALIGVHPHEKTQAQKISIDIDAWMNDQPHDDELAHTICYAHLAKTIRAIASAEHVHLVETLAERIAEACLNTSQANQVRVILRKPNAIAEAGATGVEITRTRR